MHLSSESGDFTTTRLDVGVKKILGTRNHLQVLWYEVTTLQLLLGKKKCKLEYYTSSEGNCPDFQDQMEVKIPLISSIQEDLYRQSK